MVNRETTGVGQYRFSKSELRIMGFGGKAAWFSYFYMSVTQLTFFKHPHSWRWIRTFNHYFILSNTVMR